MKTLLGLGVFLFQPDVHARRIGAPHPETSSHGTWPSNQLEPPCSAGQSPQSAPPPPAVVIGLWDKDLFPSWQSCVGRFLLQSQPVHNSQLVFSCQCASYTARGWPGRLISKDGESLS